MKTIDLIKAIKNKRILNIALSALIIIVGMIITLTPIVFYDFLITYQFRPTVRPYYPLLYGALFFAGLVITALEILGLIDRFSLKSGKRIPIAFRFIIPSLGIVMGSVL